MENIDAVLYCQILFTLAPASGFIIPTPLLAVHRWRALDHPIQLINRGFLSTIENRLLRAIVSIDSIVLLIESHL